MSFNRLPFVGNDPLAARCYHNVEGGCDACLRSFEEWFPKSSFDRKTTQESRQKPSSIQPVSKIPIPVWEDWVLEAEQMMDSGRSLNEIFHKLKVLGCSDIEGVYREAREK